jgi:hypothetical protein
MKRKILCIIIPIFLFFGCNQQKNKTVQVIIDKNIETLFILYPLVDIGMPPINNSLCEIAYQYFKEFKHLEAVKILDTLIQRTGIDSPVNLILHYTELPEIKQLYEIDSNILKSFSINGNIKEGQKIINEFIIAFSDFYIKANVESFINKHQDYYKKALNDIKKNLPPVDFIKTMEQYYGQENKAYILNPSPILYPNFGFGSRINTKDGLIIFNTFGALNDVNDDDSLDILFDFDNYKEICNMTVHEFGHSFVNPITELPKNKELIENYSYLFRPIEKYMAEQAYRSWWTCVTEHLVRLGEIRIDYAMNDTTTADRIRNEYIQKGKFIYLPYLEREILEYEKNRKNYKSFDEFFSILIQKTFSQIDTTKLEI